MWNLLQIELYKIFRRPRTYIAFGAIAAIVLLMQLGLKYDGKAYVELLFSNIRETFDISDSLKEKMLNGYLISFVILNTLLIQMPLLVALVAGDSIAGEANMGTLRRLVSKPVSRSGLLISKFLASCIYTLLLLSFMALLGLGGSVLLFGTSDLLVFKSDVLVLIDSSDVLWRYAAAYAFAGLSMITVAALAFLFSVFADNSIGPIIAAMSVIILFTILTTMDIPFFNAIKPYLFTNHMLNWKGFFDRPVDGSEVLKSILVLLAHIVFFVSLALYSFRRKDILS